VTDDTQTAPPSAAPGLDPERPPEAPCHLNAEEAVAWESGWMTGATAALRAAEADTSRLDWLERSRCSPEWDGACVPPWSVMDRAVMDALRGEGATLREAIDAAIEEAEDEDEEDDERCPTSGKYDCGMCSGEYCAQHASQPCDCDVIDRHTPAPKAAPTSSEACACICNYVCRMHAAQPIRERQYGAAPSLKEASQQFVKKMLHLTRGPLATTEDIGEVALLLREAIAAAALRAADADWYELSPAPPSSERCATAAHGDRLAVSHHSDGTPLCQECDARLLVAQYDLSNRLAGRETAPPSAAPSLADLVDLLIEKASDADYVAALGVLDSGYSLRREHAAALDAVNDAREAVLSDAARKEAGNE
jgi:hypothetical protein